MKTETAEPKTTEPRSWNHEDAVSLYNIDKWGAGHFGVNADGNFTVAPLGEKGATIELVAVIREALERGLHLPIVVRFQDLLRSRVEELNESFAQAIAENRYGGAYRGVFPIKVNQLREVVEEIIDAGRPYNYGIEVGSKPEIFAGLAVHTDPESLFICNGYKDPQLVRMALLGRRLDKKVILVAEKLSEIRMIVRVAKEMNVEPLVGIRVRLQARGSGKWATSTGESAKFGLSTSDLIEAIHILDEAGFSKAFKLLHFHVGSQVPNILTIKRAVREAARYYAKIRRMGHELEYLDVGGGLAVDYDGSRSNFHSSMNYTMQEYANDIVYNIMDVCDAEGVPHPTIVSESGRAIVAHHSVLVVEAFGSIEKPVEPAEPKPEDHKLVRDLAYIEQTLTRRNLSEPFHDLLQIREEAQQMFGLGLLELPDKARIEALFWKLARRIVEMYKGQSYVPEEIKELENQLADQYICNFSVFQSLLDHWATGQLFPIVPVHRLGEPPTQNSTLVDITCDSDGKVTKFIDLVDEKDTLLLHPITGDAPYWLGIFMVGAYQDIMGDLHNLFGRVNEVHVFLDPDEESGYYIEEVIAGNTIAEVLGMTQYYENELVRQVKAQIDVAIKSDRLKPTEGMRLLDEYEKGLRAQTYLALGPS